MPRVLRLKGFVVCFAALVVAVTVSGSAPPSISYIARKDFPTGPNPFTILQGDFNGDGKPDVVTVGGNPSNVSVLLGLGDGTFQPAVSYTAGPEPIAAAVGDFNGDGKPDVLVGSNGTALGTASVSVLLGNGDGTFQNQIVTMTSAQFGSLNTAVVGDFNRDGKLDLAVGVQLPQANSYAIAVMLGNGDGTFQAPVNYSFAGLPLTLSAGDFNGDGKLDLVSSNGNVVSVLLGNGDGTFQAPQSSGTGIRDFTAAELAVADFNGDGHLDLAILDRNTNTIVVFQGKGDGTFQNPTQFSFSGFGAGTFFAEGLTAADLNGDGIPDVIASGPFGVVALLNQGNGTLQEASAFGTAGSAIGDVIADLNGDGKPDVACVTAIGEVCTALGNGDGTFRVAPTLSFGGPAPSAAAQTIVQADFNGDGNLDLAGASPIGNANGGGTIFVSLTNGNGTYQAPIATQLSAGTPTSMVVGNFNKDGKVDLAVVFQTQSSTAGVAIFLGKGDGTFQPEVDYNADGYSVATADFNGDGNPDLIVSTNVSVNRSSSVFFLLLGNGDGTFGFAKSLPLANPASGGIAVGDFNHDGKMDIAISELTSGVAGAVGVLLGNGDGTFQSEMDVPLTLPPHSVATADFNHDGKLDLAVATEANTGSTPPPGVIDVLLGNGNGTFQAPTPYTVGPNPTSILAADLNGDAVPDLAVADGGSNSVSTLLGNGDGTFQPAVSWGVNPIGGGAPLIVAGDFDEDGTAAVDLAVASSPGVTFLVNKPVAIGISISTGALAFGDQFVGSSSSAQTVTLTNTGQAAVNLSAISIGGANPLDFSQSNTCGLTLGASASCTISVTFKPTVLSARSAALSIADNAGGNPQIVSLSGSGVDFGLSFTSSSATVAAGESATFSLNIDPTGPPDNASLTFACSGGPTAATCAVSPSSVSLASNSTVSVVVTTTARSGALTIPWGGQPVNPVRICVCLISIFALSTGILASWRGRRRWYRIRSVALAGSVVVLLLGVAGCGGGSGLRASSGTPAGTYTITVTATSGDFSHSAGFTLTVN
jgi:hypothetical protein